MKGVPKYIPVVAIANGKEWSWISFLKKRKGRKRQHTKTVFRPRCGRLTPLPAPPPPPPRHMARCHSGLGRLLQNYACHVIFLAFIYACSPYLFFPPFSSLWMFMFTLWFLFILIKHFVVLQARIPPPPRWNSHHIKLTLFKQTNISCIEYIHNVLQPPSLSSSQTPIIV